MDHNIPVDASPVKAIPVLEEVHDRIATGEPSVKGMNDLQGGLSAKLRVRFGRQACRTIVMTPGTYAIVRGTFFLALALSAVGWFMIRCLKRSDDPARLIFKWILTGGVIGLVIWVVGPMVAGGDYAAAFVGVPLTAVVGLALTVIWRHEIAGLIAQPFANLYDGGSVEPIPHPAYSVAQSNQKRGRYLEAVAEIRKQLDRFPADVEGQLLLAQIQAEDLKDLPAAELTIQRFCDQPGHAPPNIAFALYSMADWHLKVGQDREAARRDLEKIIEVLPDTEFALGAAHRIAHLGSAEMMLAPHERKKFAVTEGVQNLGLLRDQKHLMPAEPDPAQVAAECVKHLEQHPLDTEARATLAVIYADHYGRLDLATGELEQMIEQPNQPARLIVHWLNLLADLQIRSGAGFEAAQQTLQRIVDRDPDIAAAEIARHRLALLRLEVKSKEKSQAVKLGSYEQNIGLKRGLPRR
jgi:tetratricopeptide (TPR) repeat protein